MLQDSRVIRSVIVLAASLVFLLVPLSVYSAPYFYISGTSSASAGYNQTWLVALFTDGVPLTAAQTIITFDDTLLSGIQLSNINSKCSFWAPADPSLGYGSGTTPYYVGGNKVVISCGFSNPGYTSTSNAGDLILSMTMKPLLRGNNSFSFSNTELRYIGNTVAPGTSPSYDFSVDDSSPAPTPTPTPTPILPTPTPETISAADLETITLGGSRRTSTRSAAQSGATDQLQTLDAVTPDKAIPPPPADLAMRPKATPLPTPDPETVKKAAEAGDVLSLQSLKELIIPGKSSADKNLVLFNFIMMITFLLLFAILIWRLIITARANKLKYKHIGELLEGEMAVIESKMDAVKQGTATNEEVTSSLEELKKKLEVN